MTHILISFQQKALHGSEDTSQQCGAFIALLCFVGRHQTPQILVERKLFTFGCTWIMFECAWKWTTIFSRANKVQVYFTTPEKPISFADKPVIVYVMRSLWHTSTNFHHSHEWHLTESDYGWKIKTRKKAAIIETSNKKMKNVFPTSWLK